MAALCVASGFSQVSVTVKLDKPDYLVGEPVFVVVEFTNVGTEALGYSTCDGRADLTIPGGPRKEPPSLGGCYFGSGGGAGCGLDHPPLLAPGKTASFRYLLKGYRLPAGSYVLHASGRAGVRWFFGSGLNSSPVSNRELGDPVEGAAFDVSLNLRIAEGTEDELRQRYAPYLEAAVHGSASAVTPHEARQAIAEMAPPFLEKTILGFADKPESASLVPQGLAQISTPESREDLRQLFDKTADPDMRRSIIDRLAWLAGPGDPDLLSALTLDDTHALDDDTRTTGLLGIARLGGEPAVRALLSVSSGSSPRIRQTVAAALGVTRSPSAVPALIDMYGDEPVRDAVCSALATLTHYQWCDGGATGADTQTNWRTWWRGHASQVAIHGTDDCPAPGAPLPALQWGNSRY